jgi:hypothetical protein
LFSACPSPVDPGGEPPPSPTQYPVKIAAGIDNGSIQPSRQSAAAGTPITVTVTEHSGYALKPNTLKYAYGGNPAEEISVLSYTFTMPAAETTLQAVFIPAGGETEYTVEIPGSISGTITPSPAKTIAGNTVTLTAAPANNYRLKAGSLKYTGGSATNEAISGPPYNFTMPNCSSTSNKVTINAEFEQLYRVSGSSGLKFGLSPSETLATLYAGEYDTVHITVTPPAGKELDTLVWRKKVGGSDTSLTTAPYSFPMPDGDAEVIAAFTDIPGGNHTVKIYPVPPHGVLTLDKDSAASGGTVAVTVNPAPGYMLSSTGVVWTGDGTPPATGSDTSSPYTITMPDENVTVTAAFEQEAYSVMVPSISDGTVSASKTSGVHYGETVTLTVTPDDGKKLKGLSWSGGGLSGVIPVNGPYTFTAPDIAHGDTITVTAAFEAAKYQAAAATLSHGSLQVKTSGSYAATVNNVAYTDTVYVKVIPDSGYQLKAGTLKFGTGVPDTGISTSVGTDEYSFPMPAGNVTVTAQFELKTFTITAATGLTGGSITVSPASAVMETPITVTVTPVTGYRLKAGTLTYSGTGYSDVPILETTRKFSMVPADITVTAAFEQIPYTVTVSTTGNGTVSASPSSNVHYGDTVTLTVTPSTADYRLKAGTLKYSGGGQNNIPITVDSPSFTMPNGNVTVSAVFELIPAVIPPIPPVSFTEPGNETFNLSSTSSGGNPASLDRSSGDVLTVNVGGTLTVTSWSLDSEELPGTQTSKEFKAVELTVGEHHVTVFVESAGVPYLKEVVFQVVE